MELIGNVDKNGGATWGYAPAGNKQKKARQKLLHLYSRRQLGRLAKEFCGEIFSVIMSVLAGELGRGTHGEVTETKPELRIRARKAAALAVGEAIVAAGRFDVGSDKRQERGTVRVCVHFFLGGGYPPHENA